MQLPCNKQMNLISLPDSIEIEKYRKYFLNNYIPNNVSFDQYYKFFNYPETENPVIKELSDLFVELFNFPAIEYFMLFMHTTPQSIHLDGNINNIRHATLNLPLSGFEQNKIRCFRQKNPLYIPEKREFGLRFVETEVDLLEEFEDTGKWFLLNSGIPHQVVRNNSTPRFTLCLRFKGNPRYEYLKYLVKK